MKKYENFTKNIFNFKKIFLELTEYTVPAGYEESLIPILKQYIPNLKKDNIGNYYVKIGDSKTLFTSHLDTYSKKRVKINHVINNNIIKTDGNSILGGDNKNGVVILIYMIINKVPGTYFFFIGEESIVNGVGCYGSTNALKTNKEFFKQFDKAIAFDRRGKGSLVKRQSGRYCASDEFANSLINEFSKQGLEFHKDNAYRTDTAVFMDIIPEITNLSSGGSYEHTFMESSDIDYIEKIANASIHIPWDKLTISRIPKSLPNNIDIKTEESQELYDKSRNTFSKIRKIMASKGYICLNSNNFKPGVIMIFDRFLEEKPVKLSIIGDHIKCIEGHKRIGKFREGNINEFKRRQRLKLKNFIRSIWLEISKRMNTNGILLNDDLEKILQGYDISYDEFKNFILSSDNKNFIKFFDKNIYFDIKILHTTAKKRQEEQENKK
jgi:hypothetical protein